VHGLRKKVHSMSARNEFMERVREGEWESALLVVRNGTVSNLGASVLARLIELNAPTELVLALLEHCVRSEAIDPNQLGLLEKCMMESTTKANAVKTFEALLEFGLTPNVIADGGWTLLQKAMELNKVHEVEKLLHHGVDPHQKSIFGVESATNLEEAARIGNAASRVALKKFGSE
jgi:ankyrin repeat protein